MYIEVLKAFCTRMQNDLTRDVKLFSGFKYWENTPHFEDCHDDPWIIELSDNDKVLFRSINRVKLNENPEEIEEKGARHIFEMMMISAMHFSKKISRKEVSK